MMSRVFKPLGWQVEPWRDKSPILLLEGSAGGGKSHLAANKMDAAMRKYAGATGLVVRKTRESMTNSTLLFMDRVVIGDDPFVTLKEQKKRWEYVNGSVLAYGGMKDDAQREAIRSIGLVGGLDFVWMEEAHLFSEADFEELLPRMRGRAAGWWQIILTTNPDHSEHWINKRLIKGGGAAVYRSRADDNTHNPDGYADVTLDMLTGVRRLRLKDGLWVNAEGAVYEDFRREVHVIEPFEIPAEWTRFRSIDFGYRNPFVCQWWALDGDGRMYLYREIYMTNRTVRQHAEQINALSEGERISWTVGDHDAEDRATLREAGIETLPAQKEIRVGIERCQRRLVVQGDGKPRVFFFNDALVEVDPMLEAAKKPVCTVDEISGYVYPRGVDGKPNKEIPVDLDNHGMDGWRYAERSTDGPAEVEIAANPFYGEA
jgi:PBSX family phage terminase large subunit